MNKCKHIAHCLYLAALAVLLFSSPGFSEESSASSTAILPFEVNASKDLTYLKNGIRDMLASRLASGAGIKIVNRVATEAVLKGGQAVLPDQYQSICEKLKADYLVLGSFTSLGGSASIDAKVYAAQTRSTKDFFATAPKEDDVIMAINNLSWDIGEKIFGKARPVQAAQPAAMAVSPVQSSGPAYQSAHPDRAFFSSSGAGQTSPFIRPGGIGGTFGFIKSSNYAMDLQAMDVGDVDGDGFDDVVLADRSMIMVYRVVDDKFTLIAQMRLASPRHKIHYLSMADLNGNGKAEIYVSANEKNTPNSYGLEWQGDKLGYLFQDERYYVRAMDVSVDGMVLAGQRGGMDRPFEPGIFQLKLEDGKLRMKSKILDIKQVNIFDFVMVDLEADGRMEVVSINQSDAIKIMRENGKQLWASADYYGGTKRFVGEAEMEVSAGQTLRYYIPSRIIVEDVNNDKRKDVVVNKNLSSASRVFKNLKSYPNGEIHGLAWNGLGLAQLWRTSQIDGYIADYQLRKVGEDGKAILYVGVVLSSGVDHLLESDQSTVLMYPLDLSKVEKQE